MAKSLANIRIFGDTASAVYVAPKGTTAPTALAAPSVTFVELGWMSEDGVKRARASDAKTFKAWQGGAVVRRKITSVEDTFVFQCLESNAAVHKLRYRGQAPTVATGVATTTVTNQTVTDDRAWVVDVLDGAVQDRYVIPSGAYEQTGETVYKNDDMTVLEITVTVQGDYFHITNDPAIAI